MSPQRILLAEANPNDVELALCALADKNLADEVAVVREGEEALEYLRMPGSYSDRPESLPAVTLLDIKIPKVSGLEVLEAMRADPSLAKPPVVKLTSSREEADVLRSYSNGVNAYMVKPVDFDEFIKTVQQIASFWGRTNQPPHLNAAQP
ncbi:MAG: CheY-like chemotaxis protein [Limisphaerales bacterium]|jgi:CheY-like chemotaxis protein